MRINPTKFSLEDFLMNPEEIYTAFQKSTDFALRIPAMGDKDLRTEAKRHLPAADLSGARILTIDIDNVASNHEAMVRIIDTLKAIDSCLCIKHSVSGNLVAFFRYKCLKKEYLHIYYKLYMELTLALKIPIDYLPEPNRLRYVSLGSPIYFNKKAKVLDEVIKEIIPPNFRGTLVKVKTKTRTRTRHVFKSEN